MLNTISKPWVKYVNNQCIIDSINTGYTYTNQPYSLLIYLKQWVQTLFNRFIILYFTPTISTPKNLINNLLNKSFTHNPQSLLLELINEI